MPIGSYTSIRDVARAYQITGVPEDFVVPLELTLSAHFRSDLAFAQSYLGSDSSEFAICESLIYPVLKEVWRSSFTADFMLWSHETLDYSAELSGTPDYFLARRSPLGIFVVDKPYLLVVEAKRDDFARGWGQCLAAMLAAQKLNDMPEQTLHGIATNGRFWEFGKLHAATFTRDNRAFALQDLDLLCAAVYYMFAQCRQQLVSELATP
jgi:hypothetical protein